MSMTLMAVGVALLGMSALVQAGDMKVTAEAATGEMKATTEETRGEVKAKVEEAKGNKMGAAMERGRERRRAPLSAPKRK